MGRGSCWAPNPKFGCKAAAAGAMLANTGVLAAQGGLNAGTGGLGGDPRARRGEEAQTPPPRRADAPAPGGGWGRGPAPSPSPRPRWQRLALGGPARAGPGTRSPVQRQSRRAAARDGAQHHVRHVEGLPGAGGRAGHAGAGARRRRARGIGTAQRTGTGTGVSRSSPVHLLQAQRRGGAHLPHAQPARRQRPGAVPHPAQLCLPAVRGHARPGAHPPLLPAHPRHLHLRLQPLATRHQEGTARWRSAPRSPRRRGSPEDASPGRHRDGAPTKPSLPSPSPRGSS